LRIWTPIRNIGLEKMPIYVVLSHRRPPQRQSSLT
jgi:hypothetical protein